MDVKFFRLLRQFSRDSVKSKPFDLDTVGLAYMRRAYKLGRDAGLAEAGRDRSANDLEHSDDSENGRESGQDL